MGTVDTKRAPHTFVLWRPGYLGRVLCAFTFAPPASVVSTDGPAGRRGEANAKLTRFKFRREATNSTLASPPHIDQDNGHDQKGIHADQ